VSRPYIVVAGLKGLAEKIGPTGYFEKVLEAGDCAELIALVSGSEVSNKGVRDILFVFADNLTQGNTSYDVSAITRTLTDNQYSCMLVMVTAGGAELARRNPKVVALSTPLKLNDFLFSISSQFGFDVRPVEGGGEPFSPERLEAPKGPGIKEPNRDWAPPGVKGTNDHGWNDPSNTPVKTEPVQEPQNNWAPPGQAEPRKEPSGWEVPKEGPSTEPEKTDAWQAPVERGGGGWNAPNEPVEEPSSWNPPQTSQGSQPNAENWNATPAWSNQYAQNQQNQGWGEQQNQGWGNPNMGQNGPVMRPGTYHAVPQAGGRRGFVMAVSVSKGGTGKSSLTLNLGAFLGMRMRSQGKTVCVVDANFQQADAGKYLDVYSPNIFTIANDPKLLRSDRIFEGLVHKPEYNMSVLLGPATPDEGNPMKVNDRLYTEIVELLREHYDYIIIDTPVAEKYHDLFQKFVLPTADFIIVPVAPNFATLHNADNWLRSSVTAPKHSGGAEFDPNAVGIVLNRAEENIGCSEADVRHTLSSWRFLGSVPETSEWKAANNRNELVAPKNYAELSHAFAEVLYGATNEPILLENYNAPAAKKKGVSGLLGRFNRGG